MTITGKKYMAMVAALPCAKCGAMPVEVHHIRQFAWTAQRGDNFLTVPLCPTCHREIHNRNMMEGKYLAQTFERIVNQLASDRMPF
jgi:hypothetical protein